MLNNRIRGRARAALAVVAKATGFPQNNTCGWNDIEGFQPPLANMLADTGVTRMMVIGQRLKIEDRGSDTVVTGAK